jgi:hypothetical protein
MILGALALLVAWRLVAMYPPVSPFEFGGLACLIVLTGQYLWTPIRAWRERRADEELDRRRF